MLELLNEGQNVVTEVGVFPQIDQYIKDGKVFISRDIEIKCKTKHRIGNLKTFVTNILNNLHFVAPYSGDSNVLNFFGTIVNPQGRTKYHKVAISKRDGRVLTAHSVSQTAYQSAWAARII